MFLRAKDGFYKGEIREFAPEAARALLASGRAENPFAEGGAVGDHIHLYVGAAITGDVLPPAVAKKIERAVRSSRKRRA